MCKECYLNTVKICKNVKILKYSSVKNDLGAANFKRNKITQNGTMKYIQNIFASQPIRTRKNYAPVSTTPQRPTVYWCTSTYTFSIVPFLRIRCTLPTRN